MVNLKKLGKPDKNSKYDFWSKTKLPEGTNIFMRDLNPETPSEKFMQKQGFMATDAYRLNCTESGQILLTYSLDDLLIEAGKMERPAPPPAIMEVGASKQHKELVVFNENFSEEDSRKFLLEENYCYEENGKLKEMPLVDKVSGLFASYLRMPKANIDATQGEFLHSFSSLYKIKDKLEPEVYMEAYDYLINRFIDSKLGRVEEFQNKYNVHSDFALEAKLVKDKKFDIEFYRPVDFSLHIIDSDGSSQKYELAAEFQDIAYALTLAKYNNILLLDAEAQKENKKDVDNTIDKLTKEVFGGKVYVEPCQKV